MKTRLQRYDQEPRAAYPVNRVTALFPIHGRCQGGGPILHGVLPCGMLCGAFASGIGLPPEEALAISAIVFSGAAWRTKNVLLTLRGVSMPSAPVSLANIEYHPISAERWPDLEALFGSRGACGGCWCVWWRLARSQFQRQKGEGNKNSFRQIIEAGEVPGLLAYTAGQPIGWCAVAPRQAYPVLERSRILKRVDDQPVWSVVCFFVRKSFRRKGLTVGLLRAAVAYAKQHGATIIEGYPVEPKSSPMPAVFAYTGLASAFRQAGFVEVLRRSQTRPIMRYLVDTR